MYILRDLFVLFLLGLILTACAATPGKERGRVHCPACGTDFDALIEKRF
jgi:hypothetical protein